MPDDGAGGLADSFGLLLLSRLGVGLGEAALTPCALSLIGDWFDRSRRPRAVALMMAGTTFVSAIAFLGGGPLVAHVEGLPPLFDGMAHWQSIFLLAGPPGLLLAAAMLAVPEPPRTERIAAALGEGDAPRASPHRLVLYRRPLARVPAAGGRQCRIAVDRHAQPVEHRALRAQLRLGRSRFGITVGLIYVGVGLLGYPLAGWLASRQLKAGRKDGTLRVFLLGLCIVVPATIFYPLAPSGEWAAAGFACFMLGQCLCGTAGPSSITLLTSSDVRSTTTAVYFMILSLVSLIIGPLPVGLMVDWFGDPAALRYAVAVEAAVIGVSAIMVMLFGFAAFRRGVTEIENLIALSTRKEQAA